MGTEPLFELGRAGAWIETSGWCSSSSRLARRPSHRGRGLKPILGGLRKRIMRKLQGKIAVITGGNSGIGLATAVEFVAEGAYVFITGRRQKEFADYSLAAFF